MTKKLSNFLVTYLHFCFRKTTKNSKFSEFFLPLIDPLDATFNETPAPTSGKYIAELAIVMSN